MQVGAVVELAVGGVCGNVWHARGQLHGRDVVQPKLLKTWRIDQRCSALFVHPVPVRAGGRVFA
ncbi:hypothetical protein D3C86_2235180 [compost metagenome]